VIVWTRSAGLAPNAVARSVVIGRFATISSAGSFGSATGVAPATA